MSLVEWAPLSVPMERRLQTLSAAIWIVSLLFGSVIWGSVFLALYLFGNIYIRILCLVYLIHMYNDKETPELGGRGAGSKWLKGLKIWEHFRDYFPIHLKKTVDLPANRNYILAIYPHGFLSAGAFCNFATDASKWEEYFPKLRSKLVTLGMHFNIPIFRDIILGWGTVASSEKSIRNLLAASNDPNNPKNSDGYTGNAVGIIVGGAQEALYCKPNTYQIVVKKRKGFVRIAISTGTPIVPVFSFGEVDLYDQVSNPPGSLLRRFQEYFKKKTGLSPAIAIGRGFFQYSFGLIPQRRPVNTVIGAPLEVPHIEKPGREQVDAVHARFVEALTELFEKHKHNYIKDADKVNLILE